MSILDQITIKDFVYICTIIGIIARYYHNHRSLEDTCKRIHNAVFNKSGGMNFVTIEACKVNRDVVFTAIRRGEGSIKDVSQDIKELNKNVLRIMIHLKIEEKE